MDRRPLSAYFISHMKRPALLHVYVACFPLLFAAALAAETGLVPTSSLLMPVAALNAVFVVAALMPVRGYVLVVSTICMAIAGFIALSYRVPFDAVAAAFNKSAGIIAFIAVVPAIAIPIRLGGYIDAMAAFVARGRATGSTKASSPNSGVRRLTNFMALAGIELLMAIALNIGSIPTMQRLLDKSRLQKRYLSLVYSAGYSSSMVLSPFDGLVNALILAAGTTYVDFFMRGLAMTAAIMAAGCLLLLTDRKLAREETAVREAGTQGTGSGANAVDSGAAIGMIFAQPGRKILELATHIVSMIAVSALALRLAKPDNPAVVTALVILAWSLLWTRLLGISWTRVLKSGSEYAAALAGFRTFLPFLVSAGFLGAMFAFTPLKSMLGGLLESMDGLPRYFTLQAIILATALLSLAGVHMMISVAAIAAAIDPAALGLSAPGFALFLLTCWYVSMNVSPFVPFSAIVGEAIGEKPVTVALRYNVKMSLLMLVAAPLLIR
ncbi:MAG: hypothetical protein A2Y38_09255 [Spirochaetes bacterium GWB1_59_5]|nr:MAG: hypothetical protein A2Y38_09255 [Spirochaetes bacterium GWB1_59_5]